MYAIIEDSGGQMKVQEGDDLLIDPRELPEDATEIVFDRVLLLSGEGDAKIGQPYVSGATVTALITHRHLLGDKIDVIKFKRRKGYKRKQGHRQSYMAVQVKSIKG